MTLRNTQYVPVIRTRRAELKGLSYIQKATLRHIVPLIEYTKSRRSSKNPDGSISISIEKTKDILGDQPYIADITSLKNLQNKEILQLLNPENNFSKWTEFVKKQLPPNCVPTLHLTLPFSEESLKTQVSKFRDQHEYLAVRIPTSYDEYTDVLKTLQGILGNLEKIVILIDASFVQPRVVDGAVAKLTEMVRECNKYAPIFCSTLASSFPNSVVSTGYGGDEHGAFALTEVTISEKIKNTFPEATIVHGDYASIHPLDFDGTITNWVPRVDVPLNKHLYYYRYRRDDGGYIHAAKRAVKDKAYVRLNCWGCDNIEDAAKGEPQGRNPAHWIAVRLNIHMTRQIKRLTR